MRIVAAYKAADPKFKADETTSEQPQRLVAISKHFYMGQFEVTQDQYEKVLGRNPSTFSRRGTGAGNVPADVDSLRFPVESVSWYDGIEFWNGLSQAENLTPYYTLTAIIRHSDQSIKSATVSVASSGRQPRKSSSYRLPTEAEWEWACRATTTTPFHFGRVLNGDQANVDGNFPYGTARKGPFLGRITNVGSYLKNSFGLHDMHGNVLEWCFDVDDPSAYANRSGTTSDPVVTSGSAKRVLRGGSWYYSSGDARSASRFSYAPDLRFDNVGFRVVFSSAAVKSP